VLKNDRFTLRYLEAFPPLAAAAVRLSAYTPRAVSMDGTTALPVGTPLLLPYRAIVGFLARQGPFRA